MTRHRTFHFTLNIPRRRYLAYYRGTTRWVQAVSLEGERVRFPASALRPFVTADGVVGMFEMEVDADNRLESLRRMEDAAPD